MITRQHRNIATNNGAAINLGSATFSCPITVTVVQSPLAPVLTSTHLYTVELLSTGACVASAM
jgi:hypothetical protein